jgi:transglutaminase-like putative cysteine protease
MTVEAHGLDRADRVTYRLSQTFDYAYDAPISALSHRLRVVPPPRHGPSSLVASRLTVEGAQVRRRRWRDGAGNTVVQVDADRVDEHVRFELSALVTRDPHPGPVLLAGAAVRSARYLRPTRLTEATEGLAALAGAPSPAVPGHAAGTWTRDAGLDLAEQLCATTHAALTYEYGITGVRTTADEALSLGRGVCQDSAHIMLALCRIRGLAARYGSGHLVGQGGTHAWVEVVVPAAGREDMRYAEAVAFDPCNGRRAGAGYLTISTGRDYADVPPTSGSYAGTAAGHLTTTRDLQVV